MAPRPRSPPMSFPLMHFTSPAGVGQWDWWGVHWHTSRESHFHGWICKFFKPFSFFKFLFYLPFWCVFGHVNAWVLSWDGFRWKFDTLEEVETWLRLILGDICWKMSKDCSCLCFYIRGLEPAYAACIHAYTQFCSCVRNSVLETLRT